AGELCRPRRTQPRRTHPGPFSNRPPTARTGLAHPATMIVIPAVDLRDGRCVRLREGRSDRETVFSDDPIAIALRWTSLGAARLHVVGLDGAFGGEPRQTDLVAKIVAAVAPVPVEVGG